VRVGATAHPARSMIKIMGTSFDAFMDAPFPVEPCLWLYSMTKFVSNVGK